MALIKIANLILLLGLAGSTDAFAKPRAQVARGGASSSKARDAVLLNWLLANSSLSADGSRKLDKVRPRAKRFRCVRSAAKHMYLHQGVYDAQEALTSTLTTSQPYS